MAQSLIACPLCSNASFSSTSSLCMSLINVTSKWLRCTVCEEELCGLDKLTLHLLSHLIHTADFKKLIGNENDMSFNTKLISNSQPLNLVKNQNQQLREDIYQKSISNLTLFNTFPVNLRSDSECERPSLKVDDEVMIFFNSSSKDSERLLLQECEKNPSSSRLSKFDINVNKYLNDQQKEESSVKKHGLIFNQNDFILNSESQVAQFSGAENTLSQKDPLNTLKSNYTEMDLTVPEEVKESENSLVTTSSSETRLADMHNELDKQSNSKSSFLSPKGERVLGFRCDICSLVFPDEHILSMHRQLIHVELSGDSSKTLSYKCHLCSKSFVMKGSLMVHMRVAHFGGAVVARLVESKQLETDVVSPDSAHFKCSICNKGFRKEHQLVQHEKLHDGKQCDICCKTFTTKYFLRKHKRLHTGEMPYTCNICNRSFTFQQSYHKHLLYHNDDKPYTCSECGRSFKELSTLHNHQRIHTGEKPFSCETCGMII